MKYIFDMEDVVRRYADTVYRLAVLNTNNKVEADDVFQEVFLKLLRYRESITSEEHLKAWLIRVTINQCRSLMSTACNKRKVSMEAMGTESFEEPVAPETEDYSDVTEAVMELPDNYREAIHLFYYEEMSIKEIAIALDAKEPTIKTWLSRGRQMLKEKLGKEFG